MKLAHLGDALDHWKGSLFNFLQAVGVLRNFAVDPLATDAENWTPQVFAVYAHLLRVESHQVLQHEIRIADNRQGYFQEVLDADSGDLFIDPDTGVATGRVRHPMKYVMPAEIRQLLGNGGGRIVAVYQHAARRRRIADRVDQVLEAIRDHRGVGWCSYESTTVAMLFLSRDSGRATAVAEHFRRILGPRADGRIRFGWAGEPVEA